MKDIFEKYRDYIVFTPIKRDNIILYLKYDNGFIKVNTNNNTIVKQVYDHRYIFNEISNNDKIIGEITLILDENIFNSCYNVNTYDDSKILDKSHPMYKEGVNNEFYETQNSEIYVYHYPSESFCVFIKKNLIYVALVGNINDAVDYLRFGLKKVLSRYNSLRKIYSIHASAINFRGKGFIFLSGSQSGKSSLYINLLANKKYLPINDDIVFWKQEKGNIVLKGCPILPLIRTVKNGNIRFTNELVERINCQKDFVFTNFDKDLTESVKLECIFIPQLGHIKTCITEIDINTQFKKVLRACMVHNVVEFDDLHYNAIKKLLKFNYFKLEMSYDYNEIFKNIDRFIEDYSK